jgi:hypothetical protein
MNKLKIEQYCSTGQSPQRAVAPTEEEKYHIENDLKSMDVKGCREKAEDRSTRPARKVCSHFE